MQSEIGAAGLSLLGAAALALACLFSPRFICRFVCPAGACQDAAACRSKARAWVARVPAVGPWLVFLGLGAALAGYPLLGWLDPLALFSAAFGACRRHPQLLDWAAAAGLPVLLALAAAAPGLWCGRLCPLGALQDLLRLPLKQPQLEPGAQREPAGLGRRAFLGLGVGAGYRVALPPGREAPDHVVRPPASGSPARFTRLCVRCGACVRACPSRILRPGGAGAGWAGVLAPEVCFESDYCREDCTACGEACPSGAIRAFTPRDKFARPLGVARLDQARCVLGGGRECGACVNACPYEALDFEWDPKELVSRVVVDARRCTGCGYCEFVCVTTPRAIVVRPV